LNIGLGSLGESVSGLYACLKAKQISDKDFQILNDLSFKLENGLLKLVQSLERKRESGDWTETLIIRDCNIASG